MVGPKCLLRTTCCFFTFVFGLDRRSFESGRARCHDEGTGSRWGCLDGCYGRDGRRWLPLRVFLGIPRGPSSWFEFFLGDGNVDLDEFVQANASAAALTDEQKLRETFKQLDVDGLRP